MLYLGSVVDKKPKLLTQIKIYKNFGLPLNQPQRLIQFSSQKEFEIPTSVFALGRPFLTNCNLKFFTGIPKNHTLKWRLQTGEVRTGGD